MEGAVDPCELNEVVPDDEINETCDQFRDGDEGVVGCVHRERRKRGMERMWKSGRVGRTILPFALLLPYCTEV